MEHSKDTPGRQRLNLDIVKNTDTGETRVLLSLELEQTLQMAEDLKRSATTPGSHAFLQALELALKEQGIPSEPQN